MVISQAIPNEILARVRYLWLCRELYLPRIKNGLITNYGHLGLVVAKWLHAVKKFKENDTDAPDVNLRRNG